MSPTRSHDRADLTTLKQRTCIYVVGSPNSHVGSTTTARLLLDFLLSHAGSATGFDTNHLNPAFAAVFPEAVQTLDLTSTRGEMVLFDSLIVNDMIPKVVDLWHASYARFFRHAVEFGFFNEIYTRGLKCFVLLPMDPKGRYINELGVLPRLCLGADIVLVQNEALIGRDVAAGLDRLRQRALFIPELDDVTRQLLDKPEILLSRFAGIVVPDELRVLQQHVCEPLLPVFEQFELLDVASQLGLPARSVLPRRGRTGP